MGVLIYFRYVMSYRYANGNLVVATNPIRRYLLDCTF